MEHLHRRVGRPEVPVVPVVRGDAVRHAVLGHAQPEVFRPTAVGVVAVERCAPEGSPERVTPSYVNTFFQPPP